MCAFQKILANEVWEQLQNARSDILENAATTFLMYQIIYF